MGMYINEINGNPAPNLGKDQFIINNVSGSEILPLPPTQWQEGLVCVVDNGPFDAAGYCYDERELEHFKEERTGRPRKWLLVPGAKELAK